MWARDLLLRRGERKRKEAGEFIFLDSFASLVGLNRLHLEEGIFETKV